MVPSRIFSHIASIDFVMWRVFGSIFQCLGPATGKRLSPYDLVFYFGMTRIFWTQDGRGLSFFIVSLFFNMEPCTWIPKAIVQNLWLYGERNTLRIGHMVWYDTRYEIFCHWIGLHRDFFFFLENLAQIKGSFFLSLSFFSLFETQNSLPVLEFISGHQDF